LSCFHPFASLLLLLRLRLHLRVSVATIERDQWMSSDKYFLLFNHTSRFNLVHDLVP
jgi:hypothetical protein